MGNQCQECSNPCFQVSQQPEMPKISEPGTPVKKIVKNDGLAQTHVSSPEKFSKESRDHFKKMLAAEKSSVKRLAQVNQQSVYMISEAPGVLRRIISQMMEVPYEVIHLATTEKLKRALEEFGSELISKYQKQQNKTQTWRLHKKGFYINYLAHRLYAVFTNKVYFEGDLAENDSDFLPIRQGILISEEGIYIGNFENGKANGKGCFKELEPLTIYRGIWKEGTLIQGTVESQQFKFQGRFQKQFAHGKGELLFKDVKSKYCGNFQNGIIYGQNGKFQCDEYTYEGSFQNGYKEGQGCLKEKQKFRKKVSKTSKSYQPSLMLDGMWHRDSFRGKKKYVTSSPKRVFTNSKI